LILLDTSGMLAALDDSERYHVAAAGALKAGEPRVLSPFVLAELDYLVVTRIGQTAQLALLGEVTRGAYRLESFSAADAGAAMAIMEQYADLGLGLADASIVVLAHRYNTNRVLTLDERHFRVIQGPLGHPFQILPSDL
jgi:predicted nucleic acid-binding protein